MLKTSNIALVVPSIRESHVSEFLSAWERQILEAQVTTYIVEDAPFASFDLGKLPSNKLRHLSWSDAPEKLLECVGVKSPSCRQIGFWRAYQDNFEIIITLDDDVRPVAEEENLFKAFESILREGLPVWIDPLKNYRSRGFPLSNHGQIPVSFHVGSFLGIPDVDGETQLKQERLFQTNPPVYISSKPLIVPQGQLIPVNGGICAFKREIVPYLHYCSWHPALNYRRYDDIWMGIILKKWMDLCNLKMSFGPPFANHIRASNATQNKNLEAAGKQWNELFWEQLSFHLAALKLSKSCCYDEAFETVIEALCKIPNDWAQQEASELKKWRTFF